jgi:hypothetical protein
LTASGAQGRGRRPRRWARVAGAFVIGAICLLGKSCIEHGIVSGVFNWVVYDIPESRRQERENERMLRDFLTKSACQNSLRNGNPKWGLPDTPEGRAQMDAVCGTKGF